MPAIWGSTVSDAFSVLDARADSFAIECLEAPVSSERSQRIHCLARSWWLEKIVSLTPAGNGIGSSAGAAGCGGNRGRWSSAASSASVAAWPPIEPGDANYALVTAGGFLDFSRPASACNALATSLHRWGSPALRPATSDRITQPPLQPLPGPAAA